MERGRGMDYHPTMRERDVLRALVYSPGDGASIALELGISLGTARTHIQNLMLKVGVRTRTELAVWWLTVGRHR